MAWQDDGVAMLRILINDMSSTPEYATCRLEEILAVAARFIIQDISFSTVYTVNVSEVTISPDPVTDIEFMNFMVLKAACLVDQATFRVKAALEGIKAACGPINLSVSNHIGGFKTLLEQGPCKTYAELKKEYSFGNLSIIRGVFSPFVSNNFYPTDYFGFGQNEPRSQRF